MHHEGLVEPGMHHGNPAVPDMDHGGLGEGSQEFVGGLGGKHSRASLISCPVPHGKPAFVERIEPGIPEPGFIEALRMKAADVMARYLRTDEDGDIVFQSMPCPFLGDDNYCSIYESRPKACREYPHTDRKKFYQIYKLSVKNAYTCPIVFEVLEGINKLELK